MVILYSDNGDISDNKYTSSKIKGRAILWNATIGSENIKFMDRIYTTHDSDVDLFKQFAEKNGWWYKKSQSMNPGEQITNGSTSKYSKLVAKLKDTDFEYYPYMDTMCYIDGQTNEATNDSDGDWTFTCRDTDGGYLSRDDY